MNKILKAVPFVFCIPTAFLAILIVSFDTRPVALDGGSIIDPEITVAGTSTSFTIKATAPSGCTHNISYQWQKSSDGIGFIDIHNATSAIYQCESLLSTSYFRRKAVCSGGDSAYSKNVAIVTVLQSTP